MRDKQIKSIIESIYAMKQQLHCKLSLTASKSLTLTEWTTLHLVSNSDNISAKDLCKQIGVSTSAASQTLKKLEDANYIKRVPSKTDKRLVHIKATAKAKSMLSTVENCINKDISSMFSTLSDKELKTFAELHTKVTKSLNK